MTPGTEKQAVLLLGNGPSLNEDVCGRIISMLLGQDTRVGVFNYFWKNPCTRVFNPSDIFFSAKDSVLLNQMAIVIQESGPLRPPPTIHTPKDPHDLETLSYLPDIQFQNFWEDLVASRVSSHTYLRGSKEKVPVSGLQALHYFLHLGFQHIIVAGFDFYQSEQPYNYPSPRHSGYEHQAHSFETDLDYFLLLIEHYSSRIEVMGAQQNVFWQMAAGLVHSLGLENRLLIHGN